MEQYAAEDAALLEGLLASAEEASDDPAEQVVALARQLEEIAEASQKMQPGCLFVSFIYEQELDDVTTADVIVDAIQLWRERILDKLRAAAPSRPQLRDVDLPSLADHVFAVIEGAFLLMRAFGDPGAMVRQLRHLRRYLELLLEVTPVAGETS